jgi:hypothetical protein
MKAFLSSICCVLLGGVVYAQNANTNAAGGSLSTGAALLFKNVKSTLSVAQKNEVAKELKLNLSNDKKRFVMDGYPVTVQVYPSDLNKDGSEDIFISLGCVQVFGDEEGLSLFMKGAGGHYKAYPDFGSGRPYILSSSSKGFPDIIIAGRGFSHPVFRRTGTNYDNWKTVKDEQLRQAVDIEDYSKRYTAGK